MCLQCVVESRIIDEHFLPGFILSVATNDSVKEWPKGHYGLVEMNDPMFVFPPIPPEAKDSKRLGAFVALHQRLSKHFYFEPVQGSRLVRACGRAGWRKRDGSLLWWIMARVRKKIDEAESK